MFASMGTKRNYEELLKFDSGVIYALGGDGYRMQETAWGGGCSGGDIIVFSPSCLTSFKLEIVTRPLSSDMLILTPPFLCHSQWQLH